MPKLLSGSKHEEFKSNSALQIKDQKERRAKSEEKWSIAKFGSCSTVPSSSTVPPTARFLLFTLCPVCICFWFFSILPPVIAFRFCFFFYTEHLYKPQSIKTWNQSTHFTSLQQYSEREAVSPLLPPFSYFHFLFHFLGCKTLL